MNTTTNHDGSREVRYWIRPEPKEPRDLGKFARGLLRLADIQLNDAAVESASLAARLEAADEAS